MGELVHARQQMPVLTLLACPSPLRTGLTELLSYWPDLKLADTTERSAYIVADPTLLSADEFCQLQESSVPILTLGNAPDSLARHPALIVLARPLHWAGFAAQIDQLIRGRDALQPFACGPFVCVPLDHSLLDNNGEEIARLTDKEITLLRCLAVAGEAGAPRDELLRTVWGYQAEGLETHTLETHIYRLRQKMEPDPTNPVHLQTRANGYALVLPMQQNED
jgi:DNA-binding response OmpR family regulator